MVTEINPIRKGSKGLHGTIIRSRHHAKVLLPFIEVMKGAVKHLGFAEWKEGETVHEFRTVDGRRFTLRGAKDEQNTDYVGVMLSLRLSRSVEHPLIVVRTIDEAPALLQAMRLLAAPHYVAETTVDEEWADHQVAI
jgi:hypothetical protein